MTGRIEKTVFISYRRTNLPWARSVYQDLTTHGYDAFFDFQSINSGDFAQLILENIKARAHFVLLLTPLALERCENPDDWLRKEIETAIEFKRNIIPLMLENFDFGNTSNSKYLTGNLALLKDYNGLRVHSDYFEEAMERLRQRYLSIPLEAVIHPLSEPVRIVTIRQQSIANSTPKLDTDSGGFLNFYTSNTHIVKNNNQSARFINPIRSAQVSFYFSQARSQVANGNLQTALEKYDEIIRLDSGNDKAFVERGDTNLQLGDLNNAMKDFSEAIRINSNNADSYYGRGYCRQILKNYERAIKDYYEAIRIRSDDSKVHNALGNVFSLQGEATKAFFSYQKALALQPYSGTIRSSMVRILHKLDRHQEAYEYEQLARSFMQNETEYNQACLEAICGNLEGALKLLKTAFEKGQIRMEWAQQDPDLENLHHDPRFRALVGL